MLAKETGAHIDVMPFATEFEMANAINSCGAGYVPYSFAPHFRRMTETSFPSKLFEYLAYAKKIVVWAPEYSSAAQFFMRHKLPGLFTESDPRAFQNFLQKFLQTGGDYSMHYQNSLVEFEYGSFSRTIFRAINSNRGNC